MTSAGAGRIKVLWLIKGLSAGGAERLLVMFSLLGRHDRFEYHASYVVPWADTMVPTLESTGVPVYCLDGPSPLWPGWMLRLRRLLGRECFDVVHVHSPYVAGILRLVVRTMRPAQRPIVVSTEHCTWRSYRPGTRWLNAATCRLDDARIAVSTQVRDSMSPTAREGVETLIHGVLRDEPARTDGYDRAATRRELGVRPGELLVTTVANFRSQKAYDDMLSAARYTLDAGAAVRFVAVGFGPLESQVRSRIAQLCLERDFDLLGYRDDVPRLLDATDVFALASTHEGGPIVVLEAMSAGVPVVVTGVGFVPEVVTDGLEGFVVPPKRPDLLAARILELVRDEPRRRAMGAAAKTRARSHDITATVERVEAIYGALCAARPRPRHVPDRVTE